MRTLIDVDPGEIRARVAHYVDDGWRLAHLVGRDLEFATELIYVFLRHHDGRHECRVRLSGPSPSIPSIAELSFSGGRLERLVRDQLGVEFLQHPEPRALLRHGHWPKDVFPLRAGPLRLEVSDDAEPYPFLTVPGPGVYEIPVGPVHAGLIEPGHFRFSVVGETILHMSARLWFVHRGLERLAAGRSTEEVLRLAEVVSGDSAVAHSLAYLLALEDATGVTVSPEVTARRQGLLELERVTHHVADLGALANDVGYSVAHARAMRLVESLQRLAQEITGHRLLRGALSVGGAQWNYEPPASLFPSLSGEVSSLAEWILRHPVVRDRFELTAMLSHEDAARVGVLGPVARASGLKTDARVEHPLGLEMPLRTQETGDVRARFDQRVKEALDSLDVLSRLVAGERPQARGSDGAATGEGLGVVEGWRGAVVHRVALHEGRVSRWAPIDPSFFNWPALAVSLADTIVPDFPLVNKSFNLSYAGNDL
ncbi:MAG: formate hydrogenase [Acidimicrobiaceae bacterium]|nr:formate hydrogenase [Acidimicrobiaceae bacterium]